MGFKLVRDRNEEWCRAHGVSGQWRVSPDPASALLRKIFEEAGEYAEGRDPAELYDLMDAVEALIGLRDPDGRYGEAHRAKVKAMGGFETFTEWTPVPPESADWTPQPALDEGGELPSAAALRAYMTATGWEQEGPEGTVGAVWRNGPAAIGVPRDFDPFLIQGAISRVARKEGRSEGDVTRDILAASGSPVPPPEEPSP